MHPPVDISTFQLGLPPADVEDAATLSPEDEDYEDEELLLRDLADDAREFVESFPWAPPIEELLLAFGIGKVIGLFLVRFASVLEGPGEGEGDKELWIVVGDLPWIYFDTLAQTPAGALKLYCLIAEEWADAVLAGEDLSECFPIPIEPTSEHAEMLKSRVRHIREEFMPVAGLPERIARP